MIQLGDLRRNLTPLLLEFLCLTFFEDLAFEIWMYFILHYFPNMDVDLLPIQTLFLVECWRKMNLCFFQSLKPGVIHLTPGGVF